MASIYPMKNIWSIWKALIQNDVLIVSGKGVPVDGLSGTGAKSAGKGSLYIDITNGILYINTGTMKSPVWTKVGTQA